MRWGRGYLGISTNQQTLSGWRRCIKREVEWPKIAEDWVSEDGPWWDFVEEFDEDDFDAALDAMFGGDPDEISGVAAKSVQEIE
jgi:hypothetical protein